MSQNTSNQTPPTENPGVHTGGAASIGTANFTGGGHAFGSNSTVNHYHQGPDANELKKHQLITALPRAEAGRKVHESKKQSGPCFPGTRQAILQKMKDWATSPNEFGTYVLSGLAGIGKSTVAYTIADWADERHHLGAEFFFSRDEADRRSAKLFFTTIAYDLYHFNEEFKGAIGDALVTKDRSTSTTESPQEQLNALILDPLKPIRNTLPPTLIVVDALDECDDEDACFVLRGLRQLIQALPSFKVILTTRPDAFSNDELTTKEGRKVFRLHDIEADVVNEDIRIYLKYCLSAEQVAEQLPHLKKQWCANDTQIKLLIQASGKLFIMASTAVRYILDKFWSTPDTQMKTLLDAFAQGRTPFSNLVDFYTIILRTAVPANCHDTRLVDRYQTIVGTIVLAQVPLAVHSIASLMNIDVDQIFVVLHQLQSVISIADDIPRAYHKSFVDYITDSERCKDINLRIDPTKHHTSIARGCFEMMGKHLKVNILELGIPARFMSNEEGLAKDGISDEKLQEKIPLVLRYACAYWDGHLKSADIDDADLVKGLEKFDDARVLLPWFEVLSLIRQLDSAPRAIRVAVKVLKPTPSDFPQLLSDGLRFICKFYEIIERSAHHTYCSALLFTPTDSLLYRQYIDEALHLHVFNVSGIPNQWDALIANLRHINVQNIQFSPDSTTFVSWNSEWKTMLKVWDAVTGTPISTIKGGQYSTFAIANDLSTVATFEHNNGITIYNLDGSEQGTTLTTSANVLQMAISSESLSLIAAGLVGGTVSLWDTRDIQDGKPIGSFGDYYSRRNVGLKFSATGARLAYGSATEGVVQLWDVIKREFVADLDWGLRNYAFSHDGSRIVTWQDSGAKLWNSGDGQPVGTIEKSLRVDAVAISDNGSRLAIASGCSNSGKMSVEVWGNHANGLSRDIELIDLDIVPHFAPLAFSPNDTLAIGMRSDIKLYSINNRSFLATLSIPGSFALAFSPDFTRFAALNHTNTAFLSNIQVIESPSSSSNQQESSRPTALALSRNCSRLACGFEDGAVELWEVDGFQKRRISAHRHHQSRITTLGFSPDGRQFASVSLDHDHSTINLWDGEDGVRRADLRRFPKLLGVAVSTSVLAIVCKYQIHLWNCTTQADRDLLACKIRDNDHRGEFGTPLSFSADGALLAAVSVINNAHSIIVFDITSHTAIATFDIGWKAYLHSMTFLPDNSELVAWHCTLTRPKFTFLTFKLVSNNVIEKSSFENSIQSPDIPLWHGVLVWVSRAHNQYCIVALFPQHEDPVTVLWIPRELDVQGWIQRRSMIIIQCKEHDIFLRLPTTTTSTAARAGYDSNLSYGRPAQQIAAPALPYGQNTHVPPALVRTKVQEDSEEARGFTSESQ